MKLTVTINGNTRQDVIDGIMFVLAEVKGGYFGGGTSRSRTDDVKWLLEGDPAEAIATQFYGEQ